MAAPTEVTDQTRTNRADAKRRIAPAMAAVVAKYDAIAAAMVAAALLVRAEATALAATANVELTAALVDNLPSLATLHDAAAASLGRAATATTALADAEAGREVAHSVKDAHALVRLSVQADYDAKTSYKKVKAMVDATARSPQRAALTERALTDLQRVRLAFTDGMVGGSTMEQTADEIRAIVKGSSRADALRIVKTETFRARRESARLVFQAAPEVTGWIWVCSLSPTSCGLCWALHGQVFPTSEMMATHPNCTCELAPFTGQQVDKGTDLFDALTEDEQDTAIGPAAGRAYRDGAISLTDLARTGHHPEHGPVGGQASLLSVLGPERAAQYYRAPKA